MGENAVNRAIARTALLLFLSGCSTLGGTARITVATATLRSADGKPTGTAALTALGETVTLRLVASGLPAGVHGLHLHSIGKCDGPAFASAGGHLNPHGRQHGTNNPAGTHLGDLPNLTISGAGTGTLSFALPGQRSAVESALFDADGSAIVIHAAADDNITDPSGNSGPRIACGVFERKAG